MSAQILRFFVILNCENCGGVLKRPNSGAFALGTTASFLALPVPCVPGPMEAARGREALGTRMVKYEMNDRKIEVLIRAV